MTKELMNARGERDLHSTEKSLMKEEEKKLKCVNNILLYFLLRRVCVCVYVCVCVCVCTC